MKKFKPVIFEHDKDTKRKKRFGSPDGAEVQGVLYINSTDVPADHNVEVTVKFVPNNG